MKVHVDTDDREVRAMFDRLTRRTPDLQKQILSRFAETVIRISQDDYLNAAPGDRLHLHSRTGHLSTSIRRWFEGKDTVFVGTNVVYAAIHEFGGFTGTFQMPERPYIEPAVEDLFTNGKADRIAKFTLEQYLRRVS